MKLGLGGRVALVAGASRGLGKAVAQCLAEEGASLAIVARGASALAATAAELRAKTGATVLPLVADVTVAGDCAALVEETLRQLGGIDILVNNAGGPRPGTFTDVSDEDWRTALELNLMSAIRLTRLVLPTMRTNRWGRVINLTSVAVKQPIPNLVLSNVARAGVVAMAKTLAGQVAAEGITVNNICTGYMLTDRVRDLAADRAAREGRTTDAILEEMRATIPARRLGDPAELAALVAFLASEQAAYITGATVQIDGGLVQGLL